MVLAVYVISAPKTNQTYRHFVFMAEAFLDGHTDLRGLPAYYHDVVHMNGRVYAPFPPVPAVLLIPAVAIWGGDTDQGRIGQVVAAAAVALCAAGLRRLGFPPPVRWFAAASLGVGSVLWSAAAIGTTWFFAQQVVVLATAWLVVELAGRARPGVVGSVAVVAWLTRLSVLPAVPVLAALLWRRHRRLGSVVVFLAVNAVGGAAYLLYNALRFGDPLQTGYPLLTMATPNAEAVRRWGFFHLHFVPEHLFTMFLRAPDLIAQPPFLRPSPWGMSLLIASPVMLRILFPRASLRKVLPWGGLAASMATPMLAYFSTGWVQFGYRYSLDWWVFALIVLARALGDRPQAVDYTLLAAAVATNALGVYWVRALGW